MKVKKEIIESVLKVLEQKGDSTSLEQCHVIKEGLTEQEVFREYVVNTDEEERNQDLYFACRDAALFLAGKLPASAIAPELTDEIIAEANYTEDMEDEDKEDTITISRAVFEELMERIEKLEYWTGMKRRVQPKKLPPLPADANPDDYIIQKEAASLMGLSKHGIRGYVNRGELNAYQDNRFVKFKKDEVMELVKKERKNKRKS